MIKKQTKSYSKSEIYKNLHPYVKEWFENNFDDFTPAQKQAIPEIHKGNNILVSSPTGSGKTLTAFLSVINELTTLADKGELEDKVYCIYISPLKALDNDIERNFSDVRWSFIKTSLLSPSSYTRLTTIFKSFFSEFMLYAFMTA